MVYEVYLKKLMAQTRNGKTKAARGGDTSRSSSQGRKLSSGGKSPRRGNPEIDDQTHSPKAVSKRKV
jgi:hypothetical protein